MSEDDPIGAAWLIATYGLLLAQPLSVQSRIGPRRSSQMGTGFRTEVYQESMRPRSSLAGHLTFMLKHEGVPLELLSRLFAQVDTGELVAWIRSEPTGQYARRACFLYEWITGETLPLGDTAVGGNYVDAVDGVQMLAATRASKQPRWRIKNNLPGTAAFCPIVRQTPAVRTAMAFDCGAALAKEEAHFGPDVLRRSAVWMTLRESRSSFLIEGEQDQTDRIRRFAGVMERRTGQGAPPLEALAQLQAEILGPVTTIARMGLRQSPVFVGQIVHYEQVVHYVAPHASQVPAMVDGLRAFAELTAGASPIARAAVLSFGFIYIHPLADGNGRVHRFLINDSLRRDGAVPAPFILPVSALITGSSVERVNYERALEEFSKPLMALYAGSCSFAREPEPQPDGVMSNFNFSAYDDAGHAWRFPDLTAQVEYVGGLIERTIGKEMHQQAGFLRSHDEARASLKDVIEGPDAHLDSIIRSVRENGGRLTGKLAKTFPALEGDGIWERVVTRVQQAFQSRDDLP